MKLVEVAAVDIYVYSRGGACTRVPGDYRCSFTYDSEVRLRSTRVLYTAYPFFVYTDYVVIFPQNPFT